jgi:DNA-directed RNA polymerase specialized sigma24 family protein
MRPPMTDADQRELLIRLRPRLLGFAYKLTQHHDFAEELVQEGWLAIWREVSEKGLMPDGILASGAQKKMFNVIRYNTQQCRDIRMSIPISEIEWDGDISDLFDAIDVDLTQIKEDYRNSWILDAVNKLPPKQKAYVIRRFWYGWTKTPLEVYFDNAKYTWHKARRILQKELAHLGAD